jgi:hypothetical protein
MPEQTSDLPLGGTKVNKQAYLSDLERKFAQLCSVLRDTPTHIRVSTMSFGVP